MENQHKTSMFPALGRMLGLACLLIILAASLWLIWSGNMHIRYTADHEGTIPIWNRWIPVLIGIILVRCLPIVLPDYNPLYDYDQRHITIQASVMLAGAVLFTGFLLFINEWGWDFQVWYAAAKLILLLGIPWIMLRAYRSSSAIRPKSKEPDSIPRWYWLGPLIVIIVWVYAHFFSVFAAPHHPSGISDPVVLTVSLLIGFLLNSVLEEVFYRVWLQTRLELLLGRWPAILLASILWASWHIAIQGTGQWGLDGATVIANHAVTGLFLGYLWARYRNVWALLIIHGLLNAPPHYLLEIFFR